MLAVYPYTCPHLLKDADHFVAHVANAEHSAALDILLQEQVFANRLTAIDFDMCTGARSTEDIQTHQCSVYPAALITPGSPVFDVLYQADFLFKHIYRFLVQLVFLDKPSVESYVVATQVDARQRLVIEPTSRRPGFTALGNEVKLFKLRNKSQQEAWREGHAKYKGQEFRAQLQFTRVQWSATETQLLFGDLTPTVKTEWIDKTPLPPDHPASALQLFVAQHFAALKRAFPVYHHLETVFYLCAANVVMLSPKVKDDAMPLMSLTPAGEYVDGIYHVGGVKVQPEPTRMSAEEARIAGRNDSCRKAFDWGSLGCAVFAPKDNIEDCLARNEGLFLQCLELPE